MPIHRVIFRADFRANYDIIDGPGSVMRILDGAGEDFWSDLRENQQHRQVSGTYRSDQLTYSLTVEPSSINVVIESIKGWSADALVNKEKAFHTLQKTTSCLLDHFSIQDLNRSGIRLFYFGQPVETLDKVMRAFRPCYNGTVVDSVEKTLGHIEDYMISYDGCNEDRTRYHFKAGPHPADQANIYLKSFAKIIDSEYDYNFVCDIDVYESSFAMPRNSFKKWCSPIISRINEQIESFEKLLVENLGGK